MKTYLVLFGKVLLSLCILFGALWLVEPTAALLSHRDVLLNAAIFVVYCLVAYLAYDVNRPYHHPYPTLMP